MKKLLVGLVLIASTTTAFAWDRGFRGGYGGYYHGGGAGWVAPALIGGAIGYELAQPRYYAPPVVVAPSTPSVACPYPYQAIYNTVVQYDAYGRSYTTQQFVGCR
jgi:hypothetical protein